MSISHSLSLLSLSLSKHIYYLYLSLSLSLPSLRPLSSPLSHRPQGSVAVYSIIKQDGKSQINKTPIFNSGSTLHAVGITDESLSLSLSLSIYLSIHLSFNLPLC